LLFPLLLVPTIFRRPLYGWIVGLASAGLIGVLCALPPSLAHLTHPDKLLDIYDSHLALPVLRCLPEFVLGLIAYRVLGTPFGRALSTSTWAAPAICALTLVLMAISKTDFLVALLFPLVVISVASENHLPGKLLASPAGELTGTLSYSIYLTHELIVGLFRWLFSLGHAAWLVRAEAWAPAISVLFVFPFAYLVYHTVEAPGRRYLRAFFDRASDGLRKRRDADVRRVSSPKG
jgi:peptidoglycan/LPS O-acetylase OafA/YrhL